MNVADRKAIVDALADLLLAALEAEDAAATSEDDAREPTEAMAQRRGRRAVSRREPVIERMTAEELTR